MSAPVKTPGYPPVPVSAQDAIPLFRQTLAKALGPQHWWPAKTPFEVIIGSILTQSTAWVNVEKAIANLRRENLLTPAALEKVPRARLARLVRPSGYFRQKAKKLKAFVKFLRAEYNGSLARMFRAPTAELRGKLLGVHGIGPETADSILLYAGQHAVFVVDAYTKRVLVRHGLVGEKATYEEMGALFETNLPRDAKLFNDYHALLVQVGKNWCRPREARCHECPLGEFLPNGQQGFVALPEEIHPRDHRGTLGIKRPPLGRNRAMKKWKNDSIPEAHP